MRYRATKSHEPNAPLNIAPARFGGIEARVLHPRLQCLEGLAVAVRNLPIKFGHISANSDAVHKSDAVCSDWILSKYESCLMLLCIFAGAALFLIRLP